MMKNKWLSGVSYALGEKQRSFKDLIDHQALLSACGLPNVPTMLGLENYFTTDDIYALASLAVAQTLKKTGISPQTIDCVILSSSKFNDGFDLQNKRLAEILTGHSIAPHSVFCVSGTGCVAALSALELGVALIDSHHSTNVLVVNIESLANGHGRFIEYALISDSAASVILSAGQVSSNSVEVIGYQKYTDTGQMLDGMKLENSGRNAEFVKAMLETCNVDSGEVRKILANNILLPLKTVKERSFGFSSRQLFLGNVPRIAHCLGCDSLIGLADFLEKAADPQGTCLLYGEADGHAACLLIKITAQFQTPSATLG